MQTLFALLLQPNIQMPTKEIVQSVPELVYWLILFLLGVTSIVIIWWRKSNEKLLSEKDARLIGKASNLYNPFAELYSVINMVGVSSINLNVQDSIYGLGSILDCGVASSDVHLEATHMINNSDNEVTIVCYAGGYIQAREIKNLASTDARVFDLGNGSSSKLIIANSSISGNTNWGLIGIGGNNNIQFRNSTFYNANTGFPILRNYSGSPLDIRIIDCWGNVNSLLGDGFNYLIDSIHVNSNVR